MIVRRATETDWPEIEEIFMTEFSEHAPLAETCTVVIAEEAGQIVGLATLQPLIHLEPLWIRHSHRGNYIWPQLINKLKELHPAINYCFSHTENLRLGRLMEKLGMVKWPGVTYRWIRRDK